jgi:hypothetical protein
LQYLLDLGHPVISLQELDRSLEQVYLHVIKHPQREEVPHA